MFDRMSSTYVDLSKYIEDSKGRPVLRRTNTPVATLAYRACSGSWSIEQLAYEFTLEDAEILAALLYYQRFSTLVDSFETDPDLHLEARD